MIPAWMMREVTWEEKGNKGSFTLCSYSGGTEAVLGNFFFNIYHGTFLALKAMNLVNQRKNR